MPIRFAMIDANGDTMKKASNGNVVRIPAKVLLISRLSRIEGNKAPTEVKGARKLEEINKIEISKPHLAVLFSSCIVIRTCFKTLLSPFSPYIDTKYNQIFQAIRTK